MKKQITYLSIFLISLTTLQGQVEQQSLPTSEEISNRRTSFNLDEIKVRWKKAALENCTGVPCVVAPSFTCGTSTVSDIDGNAYNTVLIGTQCWTTSNLKVTKYTDGTGIPLDATGSSTGNTSTAWELLTTGAYTIYGNVGSSGANATNYGFLYNWYAVSGIITSGGTSSKKLCPTGWHVPTDSEWTALDTHLGGFSVAGGMMKSTGTTLWTSQSSGTNNSSGFTALPGGFRSSYDGEFRYIRDRAYFWTATANGTPNSLTNSSLVSPLPEAWNRNLEHNVNVRYRTSVAVTNGYSVRCLRD